MAGNIKGITIEIGGETKGLTKALSEVRKEANSIQRELKDVGGALNLRIEVGDFLTFADFFLDNFVADYLVQNKIKDAREDIEIGIYHVKEILNELYRRMEA